MGGGRGGRWTKLDVDRCSGNKEALRVRKIVGGRGGGGIHCGGRAVGRDGRFAGGGSGWRSAVSEPTSTYLKKQPHKSPETYVKYWWSLAHRSLGTCVPPRQYAHVFAIEDNTPYILYEYWLIAHKEGRARCVLSGASPVRGRGDAFPGKRARGRTSSTSSNHSDRG